MAAAPEKFTGDGWYKFACFGRRGETTRRFARRYDHQFIEILDEQGEWMVRFSHEAFDTYCLCRDDAEAVA